MLLMKVVVVKLLLFIKIKKIIYHFVLSLQKNLKKVRVKK